MKTRMNRVWRSFAVKSVVLIAIFFAVPTIVYQTLQAADAEKNRLLLESVEVQGRLVAEMLRPVLDTVGGTAMRNVARMVQNLGGAGPNIKLFFRPASPAPAQSFFYVASSTLETPQYLEAERENLLGSGFLDRLQESCAAEQGLVVRVTNPAGGEEILTSVTPIAAASGCWAVITASQTADYLGSSLGMPYWRTPAVRLAAAIYLAMALIVTVLFLQAWLSVRRFGRLARKLRTGEAQRDSFADLNRIPELSWVAEEFDHLVATLRSSAQALRYAAEETTHAFKTPIGIIVQSLEPLRRALPAENARAQRALELVDRSLQRLDGLISAARRLDETIADSFSPVREQVMLSELLDEIVTEYREAYATSRLNFAGTIEARVTITGSARLLETVVQNLLDNAAGFSREGATIEVGLRAVGDVAEISVSDQGPGVEAANISRIFERFVSLRAGTEGTDPPARAKPDGGHFGLGLWIVRRNVEAMGGVVAAENRAEGGLRVIVALPRRR